MSNKDVPAEVAAAIAMALHQIQEEYHDIESNKLTIKHRSQAYLPWSAKSQNMLRMPNRK